MVTRKFFIRILVLIFGFAQVEIYSIEDRFIDLPMDEIVSERFHTLPSDEIPDFEQQHQMYRAAYIPHNNNNFAGQESIRHISGLVPLIRIGFSYINTIFQEQNAPIRYREALLTKWNEVHSMILDEQLTLDYYYPTTEFLADILGKLCRVLKGHQDDNDFDMQKLKHSEPYPLCFEAIFYIRDGVFDIPFFNQVFLDEEVLMGVTALPFLVESKSILEPIFFNDVNEFYHHDRGHWGTFTAQLPVEHTMTAYQHLKNIIRLISHCENGKTSFVQTGMFQLHHEINDALPVLGHPNIV